MGVPVHTLPVRQLKLLQFYKLSFFFFFFVSFKLGTVKNYTANLLALVEYWYKTRSMHSRFEVGVAAYNFMLRLLVFSENS